MILEFRKRYWEFVQVQLVLREVQDRAEVLVHQVRAEVLAPQVRQVHLDRVEHREVLVLQVVREHLEHRELMGSQAALVRQEGLVYSLS